MQTPALRDQEGSSRRSVSGSAGPIRRHDDESGQARRQDRFRQASDPDSRHRLRVGDRLPCARCRSSDLCAEQQSVPHGARVRRNQVQIQAMTYIAKPKLHHPTLGCNAIGFTRRDYEGKISTLCAGCGHDSISAAIIQACWELDIEPHRVAKLSGIGCSSKTPDYFLGQSHGFNTVHGRMPSVLTGANPANRELVYIGVYGLTKGQFSATADKGSKAKKGATNKDSPVDTVSLALLMGATFVARSFSGDKKQLTPLIEAAIAHPGAAFIDVISPCVAFNNHAGSTKSYDYVREHNEAVNRLDFWPNRESITVSYDEGGVIEVPQHDGSIIKLRTLAADYD